MTASTATVTANADFSDNVLSGTASGVVTAAVLTAVAAAWRWRRRPQLHALLVTPNDALASQRGLLPVTVFVALRNEGRTPLREFWVQIDVPAVLEPLTNAEVPMTEERNGGMWAVLHVSPDRPLAVGGSLKLCELQFTAPVGGQWQLPVIVRSVENGIVLNTTVTLDIGSRDASASETELPSS